MATLLEVELAWFGVTCLNRWRLLTVNKSLSAAFRPTLSKPSTCSPDAQHSLRPSCWAWTKLPLSRGLVLWVALSVTLLSVVLCPLVSALTMDFQRGVPCRALLCWFWPSFSTNGWSLATLCSGLSPMSTIGLSCCTMSITCAKQLTRWIGLLPCSRSSLMRRKVLLGAPMLTVANPCVTKVTVSCWVPENLELMLSTPDSWPIVLLWIASVALMISGPSLLPRGAPSDRNSLWLPEWLGLVQCTPSLLLWLAASISNPCVRNSCSPCIFKSLVPTQSCNVDLKALPLTHLSLLPLKPFGTPARLELNPAWLMTWTRDHLASRSRNSTPCRRFFANGSIRSVFTRVFMGLCLMPLARFGSWIAPLVNFCCACNLLGLLSWLPRFSIGVLSVVLRLSMSRWLALRMAVLTPMTKVFCANIFMGLPWPTLMLSIGLLRAVISAANVVLWTPCDTGFWTVLPPNTSERACLWTSLVLSLPCLPSLLSMDGLWDLALPIPGCSTWTPSQKRSLSLRVVISQPSLTCSLMGPACSRPIAPSGLPLGLLCLVGRFSLILALMTLSLWLPRRFLDWFKLPTELNCSRSRLRCSMLLFLVGEFVSGLIVKAPLPPLLHMSMTNSRCLPTQSTVTCCGQYSTLLGVWSQAVLRSWRSQPIPASPPPPPTLRDGFLLAMPRPTNLPRPPTKLALRRFGLFGLPFPPNLTSAKNKQTRRELFSLLCRSFGTTLLQLSDPWPPKCHDPPGLPEFNLSSFWKCQMP